MRPVTVLLAAACILLGHVPSGARAAEITLTPHTQLARAGQLLVMSARVPSAGSCRLRVDGRRLPLAPGDTSRFRISARVSSRARPGAHSVSLRCSTQHTRTRIAVARSTGNRTARGALFRGRPQISAVAEPSTAAPAASAVLAPSGPFPRAILPGSEQAQSWWQRNVPAIVASFRNGQCTDWAQQRRPDIVQSAYMSRYDRLGPADVVTSWDAQYWVQHAAQAGLALGHRPVVGAIIVFAPGSYGAGAAGHVAVVEAVGADGSFQTTQMHAPNVGEVTSQAYSARSAAAMSGDAAITFIL